jgi:hypothetical protein
VKQRVQRAKSIGRGSDRLRQRKAQDLLATEQGFPLVREVAEEGPLGDAYTRGDLGRGRVIVAPLAEQLQRRLLKAEANTVGIVLVDRGVPCQSLTSCVRQFLTLADNVSQPVMRRRIACECF